MQNKWETLLSASLFERSLYLSCDWGIRSTVEEFASVIPKKNDSNISMKASLPIKSLIMHEHLQGTPCGRCSLVIFIIFTFP